MISWGLASAATMFARDVWTFYALRVLLGVAEAGFFPGIIYYLSNWFPDRERAKMTAFFMLAIGASNVLGNPFSDWIMDHFNGASGLHGWQWLFLLEGISTAVVGAAVLFVLKDYPRDARWLADDRREWLIRRMADVRLAGVRQIADALLHQERGRRLVERIGHRCSPSHAAEEVGIRRSDP